MPQAHQQEEWRKAISCSSLFEKHRRKEHPSCHLDSTPFSRTRRILFPEGECLLTDAFWAAYALLTLPEQGRPWPATETCLHRVSRVPYQSHVFLSSSPKCQPDSWASRGLNGWEKLTTASWRYKAPCWSQATTWRHKQKRPLQF